MQSFKVVFILLLINYQQLIAQNFSGGFNFALPYNDSTTQLFLPDFPKKALSDADRISAVGDKFYANNKPIRFWGVNIGSNACFPQKAIAEQVAGRLRKMGVNLVRLHHYDNPWTGTNIFAPNTTRQLNPVTLDRLEYFIAQLKANGIYVNINLNNSRTFVAADGVPFADSLPEFAKGITLFDPKLQALQHEHAMQYLTHVNPYTGKSLAQDPVTAMIELNNENTLYGMWKSYQLTTTDKGGILPVYYNKILDSLFCHFLQQKYPSQTALQTAWAPANSNTPKPQMLKNLNFEAGNTNSWVLEQHSTAVANFTTTTSNPASGSFSGALSVSQVTGTGWHIQLKQAGIVLQKDSSYELSFKARTDGANKSISVSMFLDVAPYTWYQGTYVTLTSSWQTFKVSIVAPDDIPNLRISISPEQNLGNFYFDDFSFKIPETQGLLPNENLNNCSVKRAPFGERLIYSQRRIADLVEFYIQTQKKHFDTYRNYLKNMLGVTAPISGTNALVGPADIAHSTGLDYSDDHSYWNHPAFPGTPWDPNNWYIANEPLFKNNYVEAISSIMAGLNMANKPYTVSEYNHAAPNRYRTEMVHALTAYSAFHDVDGIMWFDYVGDDANWLGDKLDGYFGLDSDHSIMSLFPSCAHAYRNGFIAEDKAPLVVDYATQWIYDQAQKDPKPRWERFYSYDHRLALQKKIHANYERPSTNLSQVANFTASNSYTTASNQTTIDISKGFLTTVSPKFVAITGDLTQAPDQTLGPMKLNSATEFGSITWISSDSTDLNRAGNSLLTLTTKIQNTGMIWSGNQTVNNNWGAAPTLNLPQKVSITLTLYADALYIYPLDEKGREGAPQLVKGVNLPSKLKQFTFELDQSKTPTMWYGLRTTKPCLLCKGISVKRTK
jgi:hypothetical protein